MIAIRKYKNNDYQRVNDIHDVARLEELRAADLVDAFVPFKRASIDESFFEYDIAVALLDNDIVGFTAYADSELAWIYVDPKYKGHGIGRSLVKYVLEVYENEVVTLEVLKRNTPAINFYCGLEFFLVGENRGKMPGNETFFIDVYEMKFDPKVELISEFSENQMKEIVSVWESSVRATHHFLNEDDIKMLRPQVIEGVISVEHFIVLKDGNYIVAFLGCHDKSVEMLFVHDDYRGKGYGKQLINIALHHFRANRVDVNEDNKEALGFYEHLGFVKSDRSETDDGGNPFPIIHMTLAER